MDDTEKLARKFAALLFQGYDAETAGRVLVRNRELKHTGFCASGDFGDANMVMDAAHRAVFGRPPVMSWDVDEGTKTEAEMQASVDLWNAAWTLAKQNDFWQPPCPWQTEDQVRAVAEADAWLTNTGLSSYTEMRAALERLLDGHRSGTAAGLRTAMEAARAVLTKQ